MTLMEKCVNGLQPDVFYSCFLFAVEVDGSGRESTETITGGAPLQLKTRMRFKRKANRPRIKKVRFSDCGPRAHDASDEGELFCFG
jgi:hypothetical protein